MKNYASAILGNVILFVASGAHCSDAFTLEQSDEIRREIGQILGDYRDAMLTRNYESMIAFWSKSDDFVMAGDGRILGGIDAWVETTTGHYRQTEKFHVWDWQDVHILPLSENSAVATLELRFRWLTADGSTMNSRGSWTYVFRKEVDGWKVVHSNGTHVPL